MNAAAVLDTLVVGAGWAGLTAATALAEAGQQVLVVEKSRGPGGRSATRREAKSRFDHGAQYFTARTAAFGRQVQQWRDRDLVMPWNPRLAVLGDRGDHGDPSETRRFVGVPGMNAVCGALADELDCRFETRVESLEHDGRWTATLGDGTTIVARRLLLTAPPAQSATLLGRDHPLHEVLAGQRFDPCLVAMLRLEPGFDAGFDAAFVNDDSPLSWIAKDSSKPGRDGENWVLHATPAWSRANLERDFEDLAVRLADAFRGRFEKPPAIRRAFAHRWRYAQAAEPRDDGLLTVDDQRLAVSGDWLAGSRVEGAWTSGRKAGAWLVDCT